MPEAEATVEPDADIDDETGVSRDAEAHEPKKDETQPGSEADEQGGKEGEKDTPTELPADLVDEALDLGFSEEEAKAFPSAAALERALTVIDRQIGQYGGNGASTAARKDPGAEKAAPAPAPKDGGKAAGFKLELDEETLDPEVVKAIKGIHAHYEGEIKSLRGVIEVTTKAAAIEEGRRFADQFDGMVEKLVKDTENWGPVLGKGAGTDLRQSSRPYRNRVKVIEAMDDIRDGARRRGRSAGSQKQVFDRALRAAFPDQARGQARREVRDEVKKNARRAIARPTDSKGRELTGEKAAIARAEKFDRDHRPADQG